jgi:UTP-glucose-1-phosphate uridylyltransferase
MNTDRIKEIQQETAYPESVSVQQALMKVWNETEQEQLRINETEQEQLRIAAVIKSLPDSDEIIMKARELDEKDFDQWWWETVYKGNVL